MIASTAIRGPHGSWARWASAFLLALLLVLPSVARDTLGSVTVTLAPAGAITAGAQWSVTGGAIWYNSGDTAFAVPGGSATLTFKTTTGYLKPADQTLTVTNGATTKAYGIYLNTSPSVPTRSSGYLWAAGSNSKGQIGLGSAGGNQLTPVLVAAGQAAVAGTSNHALFVTASGELKTVGLDAHGELGDGGTTDQAIPVSIVPDSVVEVSAGLFLSAYLKADGSLHTMGANNAGQLGNGATFTGTTYSNTPQSVVNGTSSVVAMAQGQAHLAFVKSNGELWTAGDNTYGQLGTYHVTTSTPFNPVTSGVVSVACCDSTTIWVTSSGDLVGSGYNGAGQLGDGSFSSHQTPYTIVSGGVVAVATGQDHVVFLKSDGTVWAIGSSTYGQLGTGDTNTSKTPVQMLNGTGAIAIAAGGYHSMFLRADGTLWLTGADFNNQLGDGLSASRLTPSALAGVTGVTKIASGYRSNSTYYFTATLPTYTVTATAGTGGSIAPAGTSTVTAGATPSYTITPNTGYHIAGVTVDGTSVGTGTSYTFAAVTGNRTIAASFAINTYTIAAIAGTGGSVSPAGTSTVNAGATPSYTISPATSYTVADVLVDGSSVGAVTGYTFAAVTTSHTITATFALTTYTIAATAGTGGSISPSGTSTVNAGATPTYTITPNSGYHIAGVAVDGSSVGAVSSYTFAAVTGNRTIAATFTANTYTITASVAGAGITYPNGNPNVPGPCQVEGAFVFLPASQFAPWTYSPGTDDPSKGWWHSPSYDTYFGAGNVWWVSFGAGGVVGGLNSHNPNPYTPPNVDTDTVQVLNSDGGGTITPSGAVNVSGGSTPAFTITPNTGYVIADVQVDGSSVGTVSTYTFAPVGANHTIVASFTLSLTHIITATAGTGGSISPTGTSTVNDGATPDYVITPSTGYHIGDVQVDGSSVGTGNTYQFPAVHAARTIAATFAINVYAIEATAGTDGSISPAGTSTVTYGGTVHYVITPATGYHVEDVEVDGSTAGAVTGYTFTGVAWNHTIEVFFAINQYPIVASSGANGSVTPAGTTAVNHGDTQNYAITPTTGYHVAGVLVDGSSVGTVSGYTFSNVTTSHTISATFAINQYTITASAGANGSVSPAGTRTVNHGDTPFYAITPATGYHVADVLVDGSSVGAVTGYTFAAVTTNHTLSATFAIDVYTVVIKASTFGTVTNAGTTTVTYGATVTSVPTAATTPPSHFVNWTTQDGTVVTMPYTVTSGVTLTATFLTNFNNIIATSGANGSISPAGTVSVASGVTRTFTMTPASGYRIASITVDGTVQTPPVGGYRLQQNGSYTFVAVIVPHTIAVTYVQSYAITLEAAGGGAVSGSLNGDVQTLPYTWSVAVGSSISLAVSTPGGWTFYGFFNSPGTGGTVPTLLATGANATTLATFTANANAEYVASFDTTGANPTKPYGTVIVRPKFKISGSDPRFFFGLPGAPMINDPSLVFAKASASNNAATFAIQQFVNGTSLTAVAYPWSSITGGEGLMATSPVGVAYLVRVVCTSAAASFQRTVAGNGNFTSATATAAAYNCASPTQTTTTLNTVLPGASGINNPSHYHYTAIFDVSVGLATTVWDEVFGGTPTYVLIPGHCYQWKSNKATAALTTSGSPTDIPTF